MGLLNLPGPIYEWLDAALSGLLPPLARIVIWGVLGGLASMALYALFAPQRRIAEGKREAVEARRALDGYDGALVDAGPLIGRMLRLSFGQVRLTAVPAVLASLPLLTLLAWMSTAYGHRFPDPGEVAEVAVQPAPARGEWIGPVAPGGPPVIVVRNGDGAAIARLRLPVPVNVLHQWRWWNALLGNPAGYLPSDSSIERVHIALPRRQYVAFGPQWARGWELPFFTALVIASVALKIGARIE